MRGGREPDGEQLSDKQPDASEPNITFTIEF